MKELTLEEAFDKAVFVAALGHSGQRDLGEKPYILHVLSVANDQPTLEGKIVALLHDIIEDTPITANQLLAFGIPKNLVDAVVVLTRDPKEDYLEEYIPRICQAGAFHIGIKLSDLKDNMRDDRPAKGHEGRMGRYLKAKSILQATLMNLR